MYFPDEKSIYMHEIKIAFPPSQLLYRLTFFWLYGRSLEGSLFFLARKRTGENSPGHLDSAQLARTVDGRMESIQQRRT
jgi:hypothetical protein